MALLAFRALASGIFGSLAAAEPRAAAARFRRALMTILGPRRASLLVASRNLERFACRRKRLVIASRSFQVASHRKTIECSLFQSCIEVLRRPDSLQTACRQPDIGRYRRAAGEHPLMAPGSEPDGHERVTCLPSRSLVDPPLSPGPGPGIPIPQGICEARPLRPPMYVCICCSVPCERPLATMYH